MNCSTNWPGTSPNTISISNISFALLVNTRAYQLSSVASDPSQDDPRLFARMAVKALSTEQVVASLIEATGYQPPAGRPREPVGPGLLQMELGGSFARQPGKPTEFQTSVPQALALMNGKFVNDATALERGGTLPAVAGRRSWIARPRRDAVSRRSRRKPTAEESQRLVSYVERGGPSGDSGLALADVFWRC